MIYSKKALFLYAIACVGTLCAITPAEREALLAEAAEKQALLRELVEKIFAQDALIQSYMDKAAAKINTIVKFEEKNLGTPAQETSTKLQEELKEYFLAAPMKKPILLSEDPFSEGCAANSRSLIKLYILQTSYEHFILLDLIKKWELAANSFNQILMKLDNKD